MDKKTSKTVTALMAGTMVLSQTSANIQTILGNRPNVVKAYCNKEYDTKETNPTLNYYKVKWDSIAKRKLNVKDIEELLDNYKSNTSDEPIQDFIGLQYETNHLIFNMVKDLDNIYTDTDNYAKKLKLTKKFIDDKFGSKDKCIGLARTYSDIGDVLYLFIDLADGKYKSENMAFIDVISKATHLNMTFDKVDCNLIASNLSANNLAPLVMRKYATLSSLMDKIGNTLTYSEDSDFEPSFYTNRKLPNENEIIKELYSSGNPEVMAIKLRYLCKLMIDQYINSPSFDTDVLKGSSKLKQSPSMEKNDFYTAYKNLIVKILEPTINYNTNTFKTDNSLNKTFDVIKQLKFNDTNYNTLRKYQTEMKHNVRINVIDGVSTDIKYFMVATDTSLNDIQGSYNYLGVLQKNYDVVSPKILKNEVELNTEKNDDINKSIDSMIVENFAKLKSEKKVKGYLQFENNIPVYTDVKSNEQALAKYLKELDDQFNISKVQDKLPKAHMLYMNEINKNKLTQFVNSLETHTETEFKELDSVANSLSSYSEYADIVAKYNKLKDSYNKSQDDLIATFKTLVVKPMTQDIHQRCLDIYEVLDKEHKQKVDSYELSVRYSDYTAIEKAKKQLSKLDINNSLVDVAEPLETLKLFSGKYYTEERNTVYNAIRDLEQTIREKEYVASFWDKYDTSMYYPVDFLKYRLNTLNLPTYKQLETKAQVKALKETCFNAFGEERVYDPVKQEFVVSFDTDYEKDLKSMPYVSDYMAYSKLIGSQKDIEEMIALQEKCLGKLNNDKVNHHLTLFDRTKDAKEIENAYTSLVNAKDKSLKSKVDEIAVKHRKETDKFWDKLTGDSVYSTNTLDERLKDIKHDAIMKYELEQITSKIVNNLETLYDGKKFTIYTDKGYSMELATGKIYKLIDKSKQDVIGYTQDLLDIISKYELDDSTNYNKCLSVYNKIYHKYVTSLNELVDKAIADNCVTLEQAGLEDISVTLDVLSGEDKLALKSKIDSITKKAIRSRIHGDWSNLDKGQVKLISTDFLTNRLAKSQEYKTEKAEQINYVDKVLKSKELTETYLLSFSRTENNMNIVESENRLFISKMYNQLLSYATNVLGMKNTYNDVKTYYEDNYKSAKCSEDIVDLIGKYAVSKDLSIESLVDSKLTSVNSKDKATIQTKLDNFKHECKVANNVIKAKQLYETLVGNKTQTNLDNLKNFISSNEVTDLPFIKELDGLQKEVSKLNDNNLKSIISDKLNKANENNDLTAIDSLSDLVNKITDDNLKSQIKSEISNIRLGVVAKLQDNKNKEEDKVNSAKILKIINEAVSEYSLEKLSSTKEMIGNIHDVNKSEDLNAQYKKAFETIMQKKNNDDDKDVFSQIDLILSKAKVDLDLEGLDNAYKLIPTIHNDSVKDVAEKKINQYKKSIESDLNDIKEDEALEEEFNMVILNSVTTCNLDKLINEKVKLSNFHNDSLRNNMNTKLTEAIVKVTLALDNIKKDDAIISQVDFIVKSALDQCNLDMLSNVDDTVKRIKDKGKLTETVVKVRNARVTIKQINEQDNNNKDIIDKLLDEGIKKLELKSVDKAEQVSNNIKSKAVKFDVLKSIALARESITNSLYDSDIEQKADLIVTTSVTVDNVSELQDLLSKSETMHDTKKKEQVKCKLQDALSVVQHRVHDKLEDSENSKSILSLLDKAVTNGDDSVISNIDTLLDKIHDSKLKQSLKDKLETSKNEIVVKQKQNADDKLKSTILEKLKSNDLDTVKALISDVSQINNEQTKQELIKKINDRINVINADIIKQNDNNIKNEIDNLIDKAQANLDLSNILDLDETVNKIQDLGLRQEVSTKLKEAIAYIQIKSINANDTKIKNEVNQAINKAIENCNTDDLDNLIPKLSNVHDTHLRLELQTQISICKSQLKDLSVKSKQIQQRNEDIEVVKSIDSMITNAFSTNEVITNADELINKVHDNNVKLSLQAKITKVNDIIRENIFNINRTKQLAQDCETINTIDNIINSSYNDVTMTNAETVSTLIEKINDAKLKDNCKAKLNIMKKRIENNIKSTKDVETIKEINAILDNAISNLDDSKLIEINNLISKLNNTDNITAVTLKLSNTYDMIVKHKDNESSKLLENQKENQKQALEKQKQDILSKIEKEKQQELQKQKEIAEHEEQLKQEEIQKQKALEEKKAKELEALRGNYETELKNAHETEEISVDNITASALDEIYSKSLQEFEKQQKIENDKLAKQKQMEQQLLEEQRQHEEQKKQERAKLESDNAKLRSEKEQAIKDKEQAVREMEQVVKAMQEALKSKDSEYNNERASDKAKAEKERGELLKEKADAIKEKSDAIKEKENAIKEKENAIKEKENAIKEKENVIKEMTDSIKENEKAIKEKENAIKEMSDSIKEKENAIKEMSESIKANENSIKEKETVLKEKENIINEQKSKIQEQENKIKENEKLAQTNKDLQEKIKADVEEVTMTKLELQENIKKVLDIKAELDATKAKLDATKAELGRAKDSMSKGIAQLNTENEDLRKLNSKLQQDNKKLVEVQMSKTTNDDIRQKVDNFLKTGDLHVYDMLVKTLPNITDTKLRDNLTYQVSTKKDMIVLSNLIDNLSVLHSNPTKENINKYRNYIKNLNNEYYRDRLNNIVDKLETNIATKEMNDSIIELVTNAILTNSKDDINKAKQAVLNISDKETQKALMDKLETHTKQHEYLVNDVETAIQKVELTHDKESLKSAYAKLDKLDKSNRQYNSCLERLGIMKLIIDMEV